MPFKLDDLRKWKIGPHVKRVAAKAPGEGKSDRVSGETLVPITDQVCRTIGTRKIADKLVDQWGKMQAGGAKAAEAKPDLKDAKRKADLADGKQQMSSG